MTPIECFLVELTGKYAPYVDNVSKPIYRRVDTGEEIIDLPPGAMYYVTEASQPYYRPGPDGRTLFVVTPGGHWSPDSRASNCTDPDDNRHYCWVRHGEPPLITVDKKGETCKAGAGSIGIGGYHGFLRNGKLVKA